MAQIQPFKAIRPTRDKAHLVASRPMASYKPSILAAKLEENPYTYIHIIHPEYFEDETNKTEPNSQERFLKVKNKFEDFFSNGVLQQDDEAHIYIYQQTKDNHVFRGIIAGASVDDYRQNKIKKHEATITSREEMFANYLNVVGVNAEPVLLCHPKNQEIDDLIEEIVQERPENEFTTTDQVLHELWLVPVNKIEIFQLAFDKIPSIYIADGHHRSASSAKLNEILEKKHDNSPNKNHDFFLAYFIDESRLKIHPFNRICKSLNGWQKEDFLKEIEKNFTVHQLPEARQIQALHTIHMYVYEQWYELTAKEHLFNHTAAVDTIDAEILTKYILTPLLNIKDLKTDDSIDFVSGTLGDAILEEKVNSAKYKVAFSLYPVTVNQLKSVADENGIMPPKSTFIEPKLRSGLTIYKIEK